LLPFDTGFRSQNSQKEDIFVKCISGKQAQNKP
jgi:hypothetical protein